MDELKRLYFTTGNSMEIHKAAGYQDWDFNVLIRGRLGGAVGDMRLRKEDVMKLSEGFRELLEESQIQEQ